MNRRWLRLGGAVLVTLIVVGGLLFYRQYMVFVTYARYLNDRIEQQSQFIDSIEQKDQSCLLSNLLSVIDDELKNNRERVLSNETIARIATLSDYLEPVSYSYVEKDSLAKNELSRLRGQLLLTLIHLRLDSNSFRRIKQKTSFAKADLQGAELIGVDLGGADLMSANLKNADLRQVNFKATDLRGANLWGANLNEADLSDAQLNRVDLRWTSLIDAKLLRAVMDGVLLAGAKLRRADLTEAVINYADLHGALFNDARMTDAQMFGTDLRRANLDGANLRGADLKTSDISEASLNGADLNDVEFRNTAVQEENWLIMLDAWEVKGAREIQEQYRIEEPKSGIAKFLIVKIDK